MLENQIQIDFNEELMSSNQEEVNKKLDNIIITLARIEERVLTHKNEINKLEVNLEKITTDVNKGKGAIALFGLMGVVLTIKSFLLR